MYLIIKTHDGATRQSRRLTQFLLSSPESSPESKKRSWYGRENQTNQQVTDPLFASLTKTSSSFQFYVFLIDDSNFVKMNNILFFDPSSECSDDKHGFCSLRNHCQSALEKHTTFCQDLINIVFGYVGCTNCIVERKMIQYYESIRDNFSNCSDMRVQAYHCVAHPDSGRVEHAKLDRLAINSCGDYELFPPDEIFHDETEPKKMCGETAEQFEHRQRTKKSLLEKKMQEIQAKAAENERRRKTAEELKVREIQAREAENERRSKIAEKMKKMKFTGKTNFVWPLATIYVSSP